MTDKNPFEGLIRDDVLGGLFGKAKSPEPRKNYTLRGDDIRLEPTTLEGRPVMRIHLPNNQLVTIPDGTKGRRVSYDSPTDNAKRTIQVAYLNGRCRIVPE